MLIEASSFRLCIDLVQSLENSGFTATEIRLNFKGSKRYFEDKKSLSSSIRYSDLEALKSNFRENYSQISVTGKNPFTFNKANSFNFNKPSAINGQVVQVTPTPDIGSDSIPNIFKLGKYAVLTAITSLVNRYKLIHDKFFDLYLKNKDYNLEYIDFVGDGPVGDVYKLYELHFPLIKRPLDSGLSADILKPKYLLKQE